MTCDTMSLYHRRTQQKLGNLCTGERRWAQIRFYELWRKDNLEPPEDLRQAQIWMRETTNGQKTEYFGGFLLEFGKTDNQYLPVHLADMLYKASLSSQLDEKDFEHPFYWVVFGYTGV